MTKRAKAEAARREVWVLREQLASERLGKPIWFRFWTAIGPCCTADINEAERFDSRRAAIHSRAYLHSLSFFEPELLEALAKKKKAEG